MYSLVLKSKFLTFINNEIVDVEISVLIIIAIMSVNNDISMWLEM